MAPLQAAQPVMRLRLIGQMDAWTVASQSVLPSGRKTRALLAIIALSRPRPVLRGRLAELLWSRRLEEQARASLRQEIHRLLDALAPVGVEVLHVTRDHLSLRPGTVWVDVDEVMQASTEHPASLALLDGDLLEDLDGIDPAFDAWLVGERERVRDRARTVAESLLRPDGDPDAAIQAAQRMLQIDRAHEGAWRALMHAHAARGEHGMAIQAYERCRAALGDLLDVAPSPETERVLQAIRGRSTSGTAPTAPVERAATAGALATPAEHRRDHRGRSGARVGVLPMQLIGTTDEEAHLAPGLAEEITTALARFRWMFVVSSNSLARFGAEQRDEAAIRDAFELDLLLDGTIQRVGARLRITVRLLDLHDGNQVVWARRFDRQSNDLLSLQDEIAAEVVAQIDPEILRIEASRIAHRPATDATAYDLILRAIPLIGRLERGPFMQAGEYLERAVALEPDHAAAFAWYAYWQMFLVGQDWADDPRAAMELAGDLAERAIVLDPYDARALAIAGHVRAFMHRRLREAVTLHDRALSLNPNLPMAWALSAIAFAYMGELAEAERRANRYRRLSPLDPHAFFFDGFFVLIHLLKREHETAASAGRAVAQMNPGFSATYKPYLSALGHLGRIEEAQEVLRRLERVEPDFTIARLLATTPLERAADREHYAEGLRRAGVPETARERQRRQAAATHDAAE
ncbi:MAG: hypothetical protein BGO51_17750 [Rhodospirillales bacterium 69-11]|nr:hypothetical protein [Rhodospirillales bacterium]OJW20591.1 MAG: hypothetical protein BGO51_17750 [Rhodospirillales bacterium 69-11]